MQFLLDRGGRWYESNPCFDRLPLHRFRERLQAAVCFVDEVIWHVLSVKQTREQDRCIRTRDPQDRLKHQSENADACI